MLCPFLPVAGSQVSVRKRAAADPVKRKLNQSSVPRVLERRRLPVMSLVWDDFLSAVSSDQLTGNHSASHSEAFNVFEGRRGRPSNKSKELQKSKKPARFHPQVPASEINGKIHKLHPHDYEEECESSSCCFS